MVPPIDYAQRYAEMSDAELASICKDGRETLSEVAIQAFDEELRRRGLTPDELVERENPEESKDDVVTPKQLFARHRFTTDGVKPWHWLLLLTTLAFTLIPVLLSIREARLEKLYGCVVSCGTTDARQALLKLSEYRGVTARNYLWKIASNEGFSLTGSRQEAIQMLSKNGDADTAQGLVSLLRPYESLSVRRAVADALTNLPCPEECVRSVVDYEERIWRSEPTPEALSVADQQTASKIHFSADNLEIYTALRKVLLREERNTLVTLVRHYGLRTLEVSPFALHLVRSLKLARACELLPKDDGRTSSTWREQDTLFPKLAEQHRDINKTRAELGCE